MSNLNANPIVYKGKILIVDDEIDNVQILSAILTNQGYHVKSAMNGATALDTATQDIPDIVLLDINMPGMNGYQVCHSLKSHDDTRHVPIIFISGFDDVKKKMEAFRVGGVDYITKPFQIEEIVARVSVQITVRSMQKKLQEQNVLLEREIQERKRIAESLRISEERYVHATSAAGIGIWEWNLETNELYISSSTKSLLGYREDEMRNHMSDWLKRMHPEDIQTTIETTRMFLERKLVVYETRHRVRHKNGSFRWVVMRGNTIVYNEQGKPRTISGIHIDITDQKQTEEALRMSQQLLSNVFASMRDAVFIIDANSVKILDCNPAATKIFGYSREEMLGLTTSFLHTDVFAVEEFKSLLFHSIRQTTNLNFPTCTMKHKNGTIIYTEHSIMPMIDAENQRIGWVNVVRDITERKRAEEALRKARDELELRVQERTAELMNANIALQSEIEERARQEREREAIITVASALRIAANTKEIIDILLKQVMDLLHGSGAFLVIRESDMVHMTIEQGYGCWQHLSGKRILIAQEQIIGKVIRTSQPHIANNVHHQQEALLLEELMPINAFACVPLIAEEQTFGSLCIGRDDALSLNDVHILRAIGDMAANALHRARLHEQTRRRMEHIQALHMIDQTITTSLNLRVTLDVLIYQVMSQLGVDAVAVLLFNPDTHYLEYASGYGFHTTEIRKSCMRLGEGYAGVAAMGQSVFHIADIPQSKNQCLRSSLFKTEKFITYYGMPLVARGRVKGVLELFHRSVLSPDQEWLDFLGTLAGQASIAIDNANMFAQIQRSNQELSRAYDATIEGWARALELRDKETEGHCRRVTELTVQLARAIGMSDEEIVHIRRGAILHDIGKMAIPDAILLKAGPLTAEEQSLMQQHTVYAYELLSPIPFLRLALDIPYGHHERWDGTGYPRGLKGENIPLPARLFAVVDVWDALRSNRPYRKGWEKERVCQHILEQSGTHFDPQVVELFLRIMCQNDSGLSSS